MQEPFDRGFPKWTYLRETFWCLQDFSSAFWRFSITINTDMHTHKHTWTFKIGSSICNFIKSSYFLEMGDINDTISKFWQLKQLHRQMLYGCWGLLSGINNMNREAQSFG